MHHCPHSLGWTERVARTWVQRIIYSEVYLCVACGARLRVYHRFISVAVVNHIRFIFSRYSQCISCGSTVVARNDSAYCLSKNPLGGVQWRVGAPLIECSPCGRQYFDWRPARPPYINAVTQATLDLAALSRAIPQPLSGAAPEIVKDPERELPDAKSSDSVKLD